MSDSSRNWNRTCQGFQRHVCIDGSLKGVPSVHAACEWAVVQLDIDEREKPGFAVYGTKQIQL